MISGHVRKVGHDFVVLFRCACGFSDPPKNRGKPGPEQHYRRVGEVSTAIYEDLWRTARVDLAWHENWFRYPHQETRYLKFWLSDIMCSLTFDKILWDHKIILLALLVDFGTTALYRERKDMYGFHGPPRHLAAQLKFLQTLFKLRSRLALPDEHMECIWRVEEQQWTCEGNEETQPLVFFSRLLLSGAYISVEQPKATTILWSFVIIYTQSQQTFPSFHVSWFQDFWLAQNSFQPRQPLIHTFHTRPTVPSRPVPSRCHVAPCWSGPGTRRCRASRGCRPGRSSPIRVLEDPQAVKGSNSGGLEKSGAQTFFKVRFRTWNHPMFLRVFNEVHPFLMWVGKPGAGIPPHGQDTWDWCLAAKLGRLKGSWGWKPQEMEGLIHTWGTAVGFSESFTVHFSRSLHTDRPIFALTHDEMDDSFLFYAFFRVLRYLCGCGSKLSACKMDGFR